MTTFALRNVEVAGRAGLDVRLEAGRIAEVGPRLGPARQEFDGRGGALIPGLTDHHIHLFALAAQADSITLEGVTDRADFAARLAGALAHRPAGSWLRVTGYHEAMAGDLDRQALDGFAPRHRLRVQHQTGSLWILNSLALESVTGSGDPTCVEREAAGRPTGRIWRGDAFLRERIGLQPPPFTPIGRQLAAYGITALTDASVTTDASAAEGLAAAARSGAIPQRLILMSGGQLAAPADGGFEVGPVKVLLDDHDLPDLDDFTGRIADARAWGRNVAVHCVTAAELAISLAAFEAAGSRPGDRIEHGGVIPQAAIGQVRALGLTVVTQPAFVRERGDRYASEVDPSEHSDLYRCASLLAAGVPVAASSDAPYASPDPWAGMAAAVERRTLAGIRLGADERVAPRIALGLYLDDPGRPGQGGRKVIAGERADLCLLKSSLDDALDSPSADHVAATLCAGRLVYAA
jgi:predicted amidohydrolase YtcJ